MALKAVATRITIAVIMVPDGVGCRIRPAGEIRWFRQADEEDKSASPGSRAALRLLPVSSGIGKQPVSPDGRGISFQTSLRGPTYAARPTRLDLRGPHWLPTREWGR